MKNYTYNLYKNLALTTCFIFSIAAIHAQENKTSIQRVNAGDSIADKLNMDAVYDRPFLTVGDAPVALGGYLEANSIYSGTDGVNEGLSFQARRLTMFMSASISKRIKFLSEMEFEDGTREIGIEFAAIDVSLHPALNLRGGIIMNPIGGFNQNHDGPKWEFVDRPEVAVNMLPATWSNAGFGAFGKVYKKGWVFGYEFYLTNGFDNTIVDNENNKTFLPSSKANKERFEESNSGEPLVTGKLAIKNRKYGEIGLSYMGGVYNKYFADGVDLDSKRRVDVYAVDINTTISKTGTRLVGEYAIVLVDVPETYGQQYGGRQQGAYVDVIQPVLKRKVLDWDDAVLNLAVRLDYTDWNVGSFNETKTNIGDERFAITPAVSFRPTGQTVFRLNYKYQTDVDILNNAPAKTAAWMFGFSTYF